MSSSSTSEIKQEPSSSSSSSKPPRKIPSRLDKIQELCGLLTDEEIETIAEGPRILGIRLFTALDSFFTEGRERCHGCDEYFDSGDLAHNCDNENSELGWSLCEDCVGTCDVCDVSFDVNVAWKHEKCRLMAQLMKDDKKKKKKRKADK